MSGVTKHIFEHEIDDIMVMWNNQIKEISKLLPQQYSKESIILLLKRYYPHEWNSVVYKNNYYEIKDRYLKSRFGRNRYNMSKPEMLIEENLIYKKIMTPVFKKQYYKNYQEETRIKASEMLWCQRKGKIEKIDNKINEAKNKTQQMTPQFIDAMIGLYERKNTSQKDKMYIMAELKKYYNKKVINFFLK